MQERFMLKCAVFLILTKKENNKEYVLLQKRYNTGVLDNTFDVSVSGHLENNESLEDAMIRETKEEIGVSIQKEDLNFVSIMHANVSYGDYIFVVFSSNKYNGKEQIMEKDKCSELKWFDINELPKDMDETRKIMIENYKNKNNYNEYGF